MAALFLLVINFLTVITDVGNQAFGFLAFRDNSLPAFLSFSSLVDWEEDQLAQLQNTSYDVNSVNDALADSFHLNRIS